MINKKDWLYWLSTKFLTQNANENPELSFMENISLDSKFCMCHFKIMMHFPALKASQSAFHYSIMAERILQLD